MRFKRFCTDKQKLLKIQNQNPEITRMNMFENESEEFKEEEINNPSPDNNFIFDEPLSAAKRRNKDDDDYEDYNDEDDDFADEDDDYYKNEDEDEDFDKEPDEDILDDLDIDEIDEDDLFDDDEETPYN